MRDPYEVLGVKREATAEVPPRLPAGRLAFDYDKLRSELEFFHHHHFGSLLGARLAAD